MVVQFLRSPGSIGSHDALALLEADTTAVLLDVRTPAEFHGPTGRLRNALLIPLDELTRRLPELDTFKGRTIIVYCRSGVRSRNATSVLESEGHRALNLEGGILEWSNLGLPVEKENGE